MTDVIYFGGAFDPMGLHHLSVALAAHIATGYKVWVAPCRDHRFKGELAPFEERLAMVQMTVADLQWFCRSSDFENVHDTGGSTYLTHQKLTEAFPDVRFHMLIGDDNLFSLPNWSHAEKLVAEVSLIVVQRNIGEREVVELSPLAQEALRKAIHVEGTPGSSTAIRRCIASKSSELRRMVHPKVRSWLQHRRLYAAPR